MDAGNGSSDIHGQGATGGLDTFPRYLMHHAKARPQQPAMREKAYGIWQTYSWAQVAENVRAIACGLAQLGFKRGDRLAIVGDNRPRLYWSVAACQCLGGIPVMMYQDAVAQEMVYVLQDAEIKFAIVEDQEQVDKMLEIQPEAPLLEHVIYDDARGMRHYTQTLLMGLDELQEMGRIHDRNQSDFLNGEIDKGASDDISIMLYTSGTTGKPKGVCQTHGAFIAAARGGMQFDQLTDREDILSYLPMAWVGDHLFSFAQAMVAGFTINCPESGETVMNDLREIGPTYYFAPPRVFENLLTQVMIRMEDASALKRKFFNHFMDVARRCGADILDGKPVSGSDRFQYWLGNLLVYGPLKNVLGMSRIRVAYTAGAAIGPDLFRFYRSIGINLKQLYGQTETCAYVCLQPDGQIKLDSVGKPAPFVEVKLADNGEILVKGPMLLKAYYKRPDATAESINAEGYFMTGDAGFFDEDGHLKIIDRAKDVGKMADGSMFAPNYIENKLKFFQHIKEAVTFGNGKEFVTAFINIDLEAVGNWAEKKGMAYSGYADLAQQSAVYDLIRDGIEKVNADLASDPNMSGSQIKRFLILHKELDADDGELTRTRKVRRNFIAEKYGELIEAMFEGRKSQFIETQVKYEDGRTAKVSADLRIEEVKTFAQQAGKRAA
ncbi:MULTISPECIES: AMP-binding protein [unclassified Thauera]|uniref:AMP-dependent synthetase/ligase n=1 Tax=unclassified Thauera TaxID=2609274 RepID=UPI0022DE2B82|nr:MULTISPECIES: AMP-binding protein [unclassified Thauera]WBL63437.1 AMP-binding protein [Thauera sp. WB-2]HNS93298.1 AMP-binding protein [Thauera sp.]HRJ24423.1 AMP-binding protein [Thauera sp.]